MKILKQYLQANPNHYQGYVDPRFQSVAHLFSRLQDARSAYGGAACVLYFQGEKVVDIYTGLAAVDSPWQANTMSVCYSTGKGVLATLAHILVSRGELSYDQPIADYWPEFAQNGKGKMTLRHVLSHQSGLFDIRNNIADATEMLDWTHMLDVFEKAQPRFAISEDAAYQPLSFGWLVGGALEKATGKPLTELFQTYLVKPLELDGAYFGAPSAELKRIARPITRPVSIQANQKSPTTVRKVSLLDKAMQWSGQDPQDFQDGMIPKGMKKVSFYHDDAIQAIIPAANGVFTANSLAKVYAMLSQKGIWKGQQLILPDVFSELSRVQYTDRDRVMPIPMHWRLGYHRILTLGKTAEQGFGHMGFNGSGAWGDGERGLSFAYTHNFATGSLTGDYRLWALSQESLRCADAVLTGKKGWF